MRGRHREPCAPLSLARPLTLLRKRPRLRPSQALRTQKTRDLLDGQMKEVEAQRTADARARQKAKEDSDRLVPCLTRKGWAETDYDGTGRGGEGACAQCHAGCALCVQANPAAL